VHVLARRDRLRREADDLAIALDRLALRDWLDRDLMAGRYTVDRGDASATTSPGGRLARAIRTLSSGCRRITCAGAI